MLTKTGTEGTYNFIWNYDNRLTAISGPVAATYKYDYRGRRVSKTFGGITNTFVYDGEDLIAERGGTSADYVFGAWIDEPLAMQRTGSTHYYNVDGLGSIASLNDSAGTLANGYEYDAWGVLKAQTGTTANPFGYTAREFAEAGMMFYRARYYQPSTGRFDSEDPIRWRGGINWYAYVLNSPINSIDPLGLDTATFAMGMGTIVGGAATVTAGATVGLAVVTVSVGVVAGLIIADALDQVNVITPADYAPIPTAHLKRRKASKNQMPRIGAKAQRNGAVRSSTWM